MALQLLWKKSVVMPRRLPCFPAAITHAKGLSWSSSGEEVEEESESETKAVFEAWAAEHGKSYKTVEEKEKRFGIFRDKLRSIEEHNSNFPHYCKWQLTKFSDLTWDELQATSCHTIRHRN